MTWSSTATAVTGDVITADFWNTYGRNYLNKLAPAGITATGDFPYSSDGVIFTKENLPAYGYMSTGNLVPVGHGHGATASIYKSTFGDVVANGGKVTFNTELFDYDGMADTATHNERLTFTRTGIYWVVGQVGITTASTKIPVITLERFNSADVGQDYYGADNLTGNENTQNQIFNVSAIMNVSVGDYVCLVNLSDSFTTFQMVASSSFPSLSAIMIAS